MSCSRPTRRRQWRRWRPSLSGFASSAGRAVRRPPADLGAADAGRGADQGRQRDQPRQPRRVRAPSPAGVVDILVAGGPDAGVIHRIGPGRADIGSGAAAAIRICDPAVPARALLVCVDDQGRSGSPRISGRGRHAGPDAASSARLRGVAGRRSRSAGRCSGWRSMRRRTRCCARRRTSPWLGQGRRGRCRRG